MERNTLARIPVVPAARLEQVAPPAGWTLSALAGRLVELSAWGGGPVLTLAFALVLDAQRRSEPVAWVCTGETTFYPPDAAEGGVDLAALPVVRARDARAALRAADLLVRSGGFGLVVADLGARPDAPIPALARLSRLASEHGATVLCLTRKPAGDPSLGSVVGVRAEALRERAAPGRFRCRVRVLRDRRRPSGWSREETCRGPDGLR